MDMEVERRVDRLLRRIERRTVTEGGVVSTLAAAERRETARRTAELRVESASRGPILDAARARLFGIVNGAFSEYIGGNYPASTGPAGAERASEILALGDLVLATVAEDLIDRRLFRALSEDGEMMLGRSMSAEASFARAGIETGGAIDPRATPQARAQLLAGLLATIFVAPVAFVFGWDRGDVVLGLALATVVAVVCLTWALWPKLGPRRTSTRRP